MLVLQEIVYTYKKNSIPMISELIYVKQREIIFNLKS